VIEEMDYSLDIQFLCHCGNVGDVGEGSPLVEQRVPRRDFVGGGVWPQESLMAVFFQVESDQVIWAYGLDSPGGQIYHSFVGETAMVQFLATESDQHTFVLSPCCYDVEGFCHCIQESHRQFYWICEMEKDKVVVLVLC